MNPLETMILRELKRRIRENNYIFTIKVPELAEELNVEESDVRRAINMLRKNHLIQGKDSGRKGMTFWLPDHEQKSTSVPENNVGNQSELTNDPEFNSLLNQISELGENEFQALKLVLESLIKNSKLKKMMSNK